MLRRDLETLSERHGLGRVHGRGLLLSLDLKPRNDGPALVEKALAKGLSLNAPAPDALRFVPALNVCDAEIVEMLDALDALLKGLVAHSMASCRERRRSGMDDQWVVCALSASSGIGGNRGDADCRPSNTPATSRLRRSRRPQTRRPEGTGYRSLSSIGARLPAISTTLRLCPSSGHPIRRVAERCRRPPRGAHSRAATGPNSPARPRELVPPRAASRPWPTSRSVGH